MTGRLKDRLRWSIARVDDLTEDTVEEMWALFRDYYDGATHGQFIHDLHGKDHVILLRDRRGGSLRGFSTIARTTHEFDGRRLIAVFSGDTVIDRAYWGRGALQRAFGVYMVRTRLRHPFTPAYWFLVSKGYKTYLLLTRNFPEHWPRYDTPTPASKRRVIDALARKRFGDAWRPEEGVVRYGRSRDRLRDGVAPIAEALALDPAVAFFAHVNPGHTQGDELACLARIRSTILIRYLWKRLARRSRVKERAPSPRSSDA